MKSDRSTEELARLQANAMKVMEMASASIGFSQQESCGECVPCRIGAKRMTEIMERIKRGKRRPDDIDVLIKLGNYMKITSRCGLGQSAGNTMLAMIGSFREEFEFKSKK